MVDQLFFDNALIIESKESNQGILDALSDLKIKEDDEYYIAFDYVVDNQDIRNKSEFPVEEVTMFKKIIERTLSVEERAKEILMVIRNNYGRYDNVLVKVKAGLFQFSIDDLDADMKLHLLVLKELNEKMYSADLFDDYMSIVDATEKKQSDEDQNIDYYSSEKLWNRSR